MRLLACVIVLFLAGGAGPPATAQHPWEPSSGAAADSFAGCGLCHNSHSPTGETYNLRTTEIPTRTWDTQYTPGISPISLSCLRCHDTPGLRARQPEFSGGPGPTRRGRYVGVGLADNHPLGRRRSSEWDRPDATWADPRADRLFTGLIPPPDGSETHVLECTTCHDPHSRALDLPSAQAQQALCGRCHDPGVYVLQSHTSQACSDCHRLHGGDEVSLLGNLNPDELCMSCHDSEAVRAAPPGGRAINLERGPRGHVRPPGGYCINCHAVHRPGE